MTLVRMNRNLPLTRHVFGTDLFDDFDRYFGAVANLPRETYPADLYETDDHVVLELAVPGLTADDIDLSVEGRQLSIRGRLPTDEAENEGRRYWLQSIPRGEFDRTVKLPVSVDVDGIEARVRNGMLRLLMPKASEAKVKKIAVAAE